MNTNALDTKAVAVYRKQNPVKFAQKFGDIDLESVPEGFDFEAYKWQVTQERKRRELSALPQSPVDEDGNDVEGYVPITPELFAPKKKEKKSE